MRPVITPSDTTLASLTRCTTKRIRAFLPIRGKYPLRGYSPRPLFVHPSPGYQGSRCAPSWQAHPTEWCCAEPTIAEQNVVPAIFDAQLKGSHHCALRLTGLPVRACGLSFRFWFWFGLELGPWIRLGLWCNRRGWFYIKAVIRWRRRVIGLVVVDGVSGFRIRLFGCVVDVDSFLAFFNRIDGVSLVCNDRL